MLSNFATFDSLNSHLRSEVNRGHSFQLTLTKALNEAVVRASSSGLNLAIESPIWISLTAGH